MEHTINDPHGGHIATFNPATFLLTVPTNDGGTIAVVLKGVDVGHYTYTPPASTLVISETFGYSLIDGDGDTAGNTLTVTINPAAGPMVVRDDFVITNQTSPYSIPDWALLYNDTGPNSASEAITGVSTPASGDSVSHLAGSVTYTDGNPTNGSFVYTNTAGGSSHDGNVTVTRDANTIDGTFLNEILIGGTGSDTINGGHG